MNQQNINQQLKMLMQDYEQGMMNYETYRQRRNEMIDEYAGTKARQIAPDSSTRIMKKTESVASSNKAMLTLALVIVAVIVVYVAVTKDDSKAQHQLVDSRVMPDDNLKDPKK